MNFDYSAFLIGAMVVVFAWSWSLDILRERSELRVALEANKLATKLAREWRAEEQQLRAKARELMFLGLSLREQLEPANLRDIQLFLEPMSAACLKTLLKYQPGRVYFHKFFPVNIESYLEGEDGTCTEVTVQRYRSEDTTSYRVKLSELVNPY